MLLQCLHIIGTQAHAIKEWDGFISSQAIFCFRDIINVAGTIESLCGWYTHIHYSAWNLHTLSVQCLLAIILHLSIGDVKKRVLTAFFHSRCWKSKFNGCVWLGGSRASLYSMGTNWECRQREQCRKLITRWDTKLEKMEEVGLGTWQMILAATDHIPQSHCLNPPMKAEPRWPTTPPLGFLPQYSCFEELSLNMGCGGDQLYSDHNRSYC